MKTALCFDPCTGAAGDMLLGALMDIGVPLETIDSGIRSAGLTEFELTFQRITDHTGLTAGRAEVKIEESHHHRKLRDIEKIINSGSFSDNVKSTALKIFTRLAHAEAKVHNIGVNEVHFHEVGAVDAIVDILGFSIAIDYLNPAHIYSAPFRTGHGTVNCAHGEIPVPAPATAELIKGFPVIPLDIASELTTPTGAAILSTLSEGQFYGRPMVIKKVGYGLGSRKFERRPNIVRVFEAEITDDSVKQETDIIETDIDDDTPEVIASVMDMLRDKACDVTVQQILMKKGRPGYRITVVAEKGDAPKIANILFTHTSTIGVRVIPSGRFVLPRETVEVDTRWGRVSAKKIERPDRTEVVPEYEECIKIAEANNISVREVMREVIKNAE